MPTTSGSHKSNVKNLKVYKNFGPTEPFSHGEIAIWKKCGHIVFLVYLTKAKISCKLNDTANLLYNWQKLNILKAENSSESCPRDHLKH